MDPTENRHPASQDAEGDAPLDRLRQVLPSREALRTTALRAAAVFFLSFVVAWIFRDPLTALIRWPLAAGSPDAAVQTIFLRVFDAFFIHMKLCAYVAFLPTLPYLVFRLWRLARAGFAARGAQLGWGPPFALLGCFLAGLAFALVVALPMAFRFLVGYSMEGEGIFLGRGDPSASDLLQVSMSEHVSLTMDMLVAFGVGFQLPLAMALLARMGLVSSRAFAARRGEALVGLAVFAAVLTPPDPWTLFILLVPLMALYEAGIRLGRLAERRAPSSPPSGE
ncbi:MAG: preprotein translocase subunit TatC [Myxococcales bacterium]|nr:MAG: preprotein translocase subunit TatC [Myxococcales bacterium]